MKMKNVLVLALLLSASAAMAMEEHVDRVVNEVLANAAKLKAANPKAVPLAFWDFDGTIIKGDVSEGLIENGAERFKGILEMSMREGWCGPFKGDEGWRRYRDVDYPRLKEFGLYLAWPFNAQIYAGVKLADFDAFCHRLYRETYRKWYFASSIAIMKRLEAAGVENHVVSASPEIFIANADETLGLERSRLNGIRVGIDGGYVTTRIEEPVPFGEGKVELVRRVVNARPNAYAIAGFGNSYSTDGAFLRYIVSQPSLPGAAKGFALMVNGGKPKPGFEGLFTCVNQNEVTGN